MKKNTAQSLFLALSIAFLAPAAPAQEESVPVAPIGPETYQGWTNALRLQNAIIEVVIAPEAGRIVHLGLKGKDNLLRLDPALAGKKPDPAQTWNNVGGDWLWPVSQSMWTVFDGQDWPPPAFLAEEPWTGTAWKNSDGSLLCLISRTYGEPLSIKVSRSIRMDKEKAAVTIRQRVERTAPSDVPVVLWNISQVAQAGQVALPVDADSRFHGGLKSLMGKKPTDSQLISCGDVSVYQVAEGAETKLGTDSPRSWIAAARDTHVIFESVQNTAQGSFPDGGCIIELYSNHGLGYSEIETLSPEVNLPPGKVLENTLRIVLASTESPLPACLWADFIRTLAGETIPAPAASAK